MKPSTGTDTDEEGANEAAATEQFDVWLTLQRATKKKRADIIADIIGHPKGAPSVEELAYMNPPLSEDAIRGQLRTLQEADVVQVRSFEPGNRVRDFPYQFYELTVAARELFDRNGLFPEAPWQRQYQSVEKTQRIKDVEAMPRPDE